MTHYQGFRVLVADDEFSVISDYRSILCPRSGGEAGNGLSKLEEDLFGQALAHPDFPEIDLVTCQQGLDAIAAVRESVKANRPFAVAFIDMRMAPGIDGLQTAEQIRALDPEIHIVLVTAFTDLHPMAVVDRAGPADKLLLLHKPFHAPEIQQMALSLGMRWQAERAYGVADRGLAAVIQGGVSDLLDNLPLGIMIFDRRDRLMSVNAEMLRLTPELEPHLTPGTDYTSIIQASAQELLPKDTLYLEGAWVRDRLEWHAKSGGVLEQRLQGNRWLLLAEGGGPSGETYCLHFDISELKKRENNRIVASRMAQMAQAFGAFCKQLPIVPGERGLGDPGEAGGPRALQEKLAEWPLEEGAPETANDKQLQWLSGKLEAIAQIQRLDPEPLVLNRVVGEAVRQMRHEVPPSLDVEVIAGAGLWPVNVDKARFDEMLRELVKNACAAMGAGGQLTIETANMRLDREFVASRPGLSPGDHVRLSVSDSGPGMSAEMAERAFNPFFTSKEDDGHLGLGLSVAYGFAVQSGGHIEIAQSDRGGAAVSVYFPRAEKVLEVIGGDDSVRGTVRRSAG